MLTKKTCETCKHVFWAWDLTYKGKGYVAECRKYQQPNSLPKEQVCSKYVQRNAENTT